MLCPFCGNEHPENELACPVTRKPLKKYCLNEVCSYFREPIFPIEQDVCSCCGQPLYLSQHKYVDLGLSVKWAACNLGATKPEEAGSYFAWGEIEPKPSYSDENYIGWNKVLKHYNVYHSPVLSLKDDAANYKLGHGWRIPTKIEWMELDTYCIWSLASLNGSLGCRIQSKLPGYSDNYIFIPFVGASYSHNNFTGCYWTSDKHDKKTEKANCTVLCTTGHIPHCRLENRRCGLSIRPVFDSTI